MIKIDKSLKDKAPSLAIGFIHAKVQVQDSNSDLKNKLQELCNDYEKSLEMEDIAKLKPIYHSREAYKACGKQPSRYRVSSEALLRRIVKGQGIYFVNNIVDINNYMSLKSQNSICLFDVDKISQPIQFTIAREGASYEGIGRGELNIEFLPAFEDVEGYFGSPTSDSERAKVTSETKEIYMNIISFGGKEGLSEFIDEAEEMLKEFAEAVVVEKGILE